MGNDYTKATIPAYSINVITLAFRTGTANKMGGLSDIRTTTSSLSPTPKLYAGAYTQSLRVFTTVSGTVAKDWTITSLVLHEAGAIDCDTFILLFRVLTGIYDDIDVSDVSNISVKMISVSAS